MDMSEQVDAQADDAQSVYKDFDVHLASDFGTKFSSVAYHLKGWPIPSRAGDIPIIGGYLGRSQNAASD
jgi:hypothetical protein